ncbi:MAG: hypothetical protein J4432_05325 [DPANN group archaeon]|nr:hypothetical protein [DPANN group archaeon]
MSVSRGQASFEFLGAFTVFFVLVLIFIGLFFSRAGDVVELNSLSRTVQFADDISNKINIISVEGHGAAIEFDLDEQLYGENYTLELNTTNRVLEVITEDETEYATAYLITDNVEVISWNYGGTQVIENVNGKVIVK